MRKYFLSLILTIIGLAIPVLQSYWVRQTISDKYTHSEFGIPSYVGVIKDGDRSETSVHQETLFIYFAIVMSFGFLAGRLWPRKCNHSGQPWVATFHKPSS